MKNLHQHVLISAFCIFLLSCASAPDELAKQSQAPETTQTQETQTPEKVESLSAFKDTTIQTSNGEIEISPTVVAPTDQATAQQTDTDVPQTEYSDPLESINRSIFAFNHFTYEYALIPLAKGYNNVVPEPVQNSVGNVFSNIREPLNLINNTLTGDIDEAGLNLGRFLVNSTIGILGIFDPAKAWFGWQEKPQSVAQTLRRWNVGSGAYVVIPFLGPSDMRGLSSTVTESIFHPVGYVLDSPDDTIVRVIDGFEDFTTQAELYEALYENAEDPYIYFRNQHIQNTNRDELADDKRVKEVNLVSDNSNE